MKKPTKRAGAVVGAAAVCAGLVGGGLAVTGGATAAGSTDPNTYSTSTPIKHLVVLFGENVSFDHYFGTYPKAANSDGVAFAAAPGTATPKNLVSDKQIAGNPNSVNPFRLGYAQALTPSQNHNYTPEQKAMDADATTHVAKMDKFPENTSKNSCSAPQFCTSGLTMGYYDGNTVAAEWNYAQNYAMSDNSWSDNFGPSTVGALNVVSGQTGGAISYSSTGANPTVATNTADPTKPVANSTSISANKLIDPADPSKGSIGTVIGDPDPAFDDCGSVASGNAAGMTGQNIGDVLNAKGVTWGWFQGGFTPDAAWDGNAADKVACTSTHNTIGGTTTKDYSAHHDPFQYYRSTANPHHLPGTPGVAIGAPDDQHQNSDGTWTGANHQYDLDVFEQAVTDDTLPAVSYVKADAYQDGHPSNSDPIDEGHFYSRVINALEKSPEWRSTAVVIAYDDSDGWYDHVAPQIGNHSNTTDDAAVCTDSADAPAGGIEDRCGPSQRLPFLVISPYARADYIDHTKTGQASVVKFIEQNWELPVSNGSAIDDAAVSGSFDKTDGSIAGMFDFRAKARTTPLILAQDGTVLSGGRTVTPVKPAPGKPAPPAANAQLAHAQAKLARDQKALAHAKKVAKRAHGAKKLAAQKKVAKLKRKVAQDKRAVKAAG